ncbi:MAG: hypothetical protein ACLPUT_17685 [Solirubrobacteraceae bacterium]
MEHVVVCEAVLSSGLRDAHGMTRCLVSRRLSRNLVKPGSEGLPSGKQIKFTVTVTTSSRSATATVTKTLKKP